MVKMYLPHSGSYLVPSASLWFLSRVNSRLAVAADWTMCQGLEGGSPETPDPSRTSGGKCEESGEPAYSHAEEGLVFS